MGRHASGHAGHPAASMGGAAQSSTGITALAASPASTATALIIFAMSRISRSRALARPGWVPKWRRPDTGGYPGLHPEWVPDVLPGNVNDLSAAREMALAVIGAFTAQMPALAGGGKYSHHHGLAPLWRDGLHGGQRGHPGHEQRARHLPRHRRRLGRELIGRNRHQLGVAGTLVTPAQHLVTGGERIHPLTGRAHHAGQVGALPGGKGGRPLLVHPPLADRDLARV